MIRLFLMTKRVVRRSLTDEVAGKKRSSNHRVSTSSTANAVPLPLKGKARRYYYPSGFVGGLSRIEMIRLYFYVTVTIS